MLKDDPEAVQATHLSYFEAGENPHSIRIAVISHLWTFTIRQVYVTVDLAPFSVGSNFTAQALKLQQHAHTKPHSRAMSRQG